MELACIVDSSLDAFAGVTPRESIFGVSACRAVSNIRLDELEPAFSWLCRSETELVLRCSRWDLDGAVSPAASNGWLNESSAVVEKADFARVLFMESCTV